MSWYSQCILVSDLNGDVTPRIFFNSSKLKYERKWVHFSLYEFFIFISIYTHVHEREKCAPLIIVEAVLNVYGNVS